jgi:hypothetical protein
MWPSRMPSTTVKPCEISAASTLRFHLFRGGVKSGVPNMKEIIPEAWMWRHLWLHRSTLLAALFAPWWNAAAWLVALGLLLQGMLLEYALLIAIAVYRRTLERIKVDLP